MNKIIGIGLFFLYLFTVIRPIIPYIEYAVNKNYIAKVLCVNKKKPELHCNGKCYLNRQLKKVNESEATSNSSMPPKIELEKHSIALINNNIYFNELTYCCFFIISFPNYLFNIKINFLEIPTTPPKVFFNLSEIKKNTLFN